MPFFGLFSLGSLAFVMGLGPDKWEPVMALQRTLIIVGAGALLIAICVLPFSFGVRVTGLVGAASALAFWRINSIADPAMAVVWPVLGSMFMFRLMLYVYELEQEREARSIWRTVAYFFMFPNACFALYPVVDWRAFGRQYYNDEPVRIYQTGLRWIARGMLQCVGYELVLRCLFWHAERVTNGDELARYVFSNYGLYLRVSGQFHIVTGVLHLFGWNLTGTNDKYYLADSFMDYWRRVNIYWKDLMVTLFYNPVAYRARRKSALHAVLLGSLAAFLATWFLHGYQAFWLTGAFRFSVPDGIFWAALGVLVIMNANREAKRPRARPLVRQFGLRRSLTACARTVAVFATLCALWSLWSCSSWRAWVVLWRHADARFWMWTVLVAVVVFLSKLALEMAHAYGEDALPVQLRGSDGRTATWAMGLFTCALPLGLLWLGQNVLLEALPAPTSGDALVTVAGPKAASELRTGRGYYEDLIESSAPRW